jgi:hypothetical protein
MKVPIAVGCVLLAATATQAAEAVPRETPRIASASNAEAFEALRARIRIESIQDLSAQWFGILFVARRWNGLVWTDVALHDPLNPRTLEDNFADWNLTSRASLLLSYAKLVSETETPSKLPSSDSLRAALERERASRARIAQLVRTGRYAESWTPFVVAYRRWIKSVNATLPAHDTGDDEEEDTSLLAAQLAREGGMSELVRELRIDPGDVAGEMIRLVADWRREHGVPNVANGHDIDLFYVCDSAATEVHVHPWHELAPAFYRASENAKKRTGDAQPLLIMTAFDAISREIKAWSVKHQGADSAVRDRALNEMAKARGIYSLLEAKESFFFR